jgi:competence protein ComEC
LLFLIGSLYARAPAPEDGHAVLPAFNGQNVTLRAVVTAYPELRDTNIRLRVSAAAIVLDGRQEAVSGDAVIYIPRYPEYRYGDILELEGELSRPEEFDGFDYAGYLARQNVFSVMFYPGVTLAGTGEGSFLLSWIYGVRQSLAYSLARALPEPQVSVAQGILLGLRGNIPSGITQDFTRSGTMHLLAISGLNLTLISGLLVSTLVHFMGRRHYYYVWLTGGAVWFYVILCGASPSVVRAAIMASVFLTAELAGRQKNAGPALFLAAAIMAAGNPAVLKDVSFQLSFLAMFGLVYIYPFLGAGLKKFSEKLPEWPVKSPLMYAMDNLAVSLAAMLALWPALVFYFGTVSLAGPVATVLASPLLPAIIVLSLLAAASGLACPALAVVTGSAVWLLASILLLIAEVFARFPALEAAPLNVPAVTGYYLLLAAVLWGLGRLRRRRLAREYAAP